MVKTGAKIRNNSNFNNVSTAKVLISLHRYQNVKIYGLSVLFVF